MATIPDDVVCEILTYLPPNLPEATVSRATRTEKPHIKAYFNAFQMDVTTQNLKYFNEQKKRHDPRSLADIKAGRPIKKLSCWEWRTWNLRELRHEHRHRCFALTAKGTRCSQKTYGLFCDRWHKASTTCYFASHTGILESIHPSPLGN